MYELWTYRDGTFRYIGSDPALWRAQERADGFARKHPGVEVMIWNGVTQVYSSGVFA